MEVPELQPVAVMFLWGIAVVIRSPKASRMSESWSPALTVMLMCGRMWLPGKIGTTLFTCWQTPRDTFDRQMSGNIDTFSNAIDVDMVIMLNVEGVGGVDIQLDGGDDELLNMLGKARFQRKLIAAETVIACKVFVLMPHPASNEEIRAPSAWKAALPSPQNS